MSPDFHDSKVAQPTVSIVIPTFNHAAFLRLALESVISQTMKDWEAIIINNHSTDSTVEIVESFLDDRIQLVNYANNGIIASSRNEGIRRSRAQLVAFLDSDDLWYPNKLEVCLGEFEKGADVVCHGEYWVSSGSRKRSVFYGPAKHASHLKLLYRGNCLSTSATIVKRDILTIAHGFSEDPRFITAEDYDLWLKLSLQTSKFVFVPEVLGEFRRHDLGASSAVERHLAAELAVIDHHVQRANQSMITTLRSRHRQSKALYSAGRSQMRVGSNRIALLYFFKAICRSPLFTRTYAAIGMTLFQLLRNTEK